MLLWVPTTHQFWCTGLGGGSCSVFPLPLAWDRLLVGGCSESCRKYKICQRRGEEGGMQVQLNCRGEHLVWKSCADASVPPYALQSPHVCHCWTAGRQRWAKIGVFYLQGPRWGALAQEPLVESLCLGSLCLVGTPGHDWGLGEQEGLDHSMASLQPYHASGCWWASINLTATSGSLFGALRGREEQLARLSGHCVASRRPALVRAGLCATETKHLSSSCGASPLLPVCPSKIWNRDRKLIYASRPCW